MRDKPKQPKTTNKNNETPSKGMAVINYVEGVAEKNKERLPETKCPSPYVTQTSWKASLSTPRIKRTSPRPAMLYMTYHKKAVISHTKGKLDACLVHAWMNIKKTLKKIKDTKFTRANWKASTSEQHKSAIIDHIAQENHVIDWEGPLFWTEIQTPSLVTYAEGGRLLTVMTGPCF